MAAHSPMGNDTAIVAMIEQFVADVNDGRINAAIERFDESATIVEDLAPFRWHGPDAASQWLAAMAANAERIGITSIIMKLGAPKRIEAEGDHAYAIFGGLVVLGSPDGVLREEGLLTFVLTRTLDRWIISALTWTGDRPTA